MFTHLEHDQFLNIKKHLVIRLKILITSLRQWLLNGKEPIGSMGTDVPLAVLSDQPQHLSYLFQTIICTGYQSADRSDP